MLNSDINALPYPKAILFDWDMTLANSWQGIYKALNKTLEHFGHATWTEEQAKIQSQQALRDYFPTVFGEENYKQARSFFYKTFETTHLDHIQAMPQAINVLEFIKNRNIPMAVVSNKNKIFLPQEVEKLGFKEFFCPIVGAGAAKSDKPSPEPVFMALESLQISPGPHIWYIGDSITDARTSVASQSSNIIINSDVNSVKQFPEDIFPDVYFLDLGSFLEQLSDYLNKNIE